MILKLHFLNTQKSVSVFVQHVPRINGEIPSVDEATLDHQRLLDRSPAFFLFLFIFFLLMAVESFVRFSLLSYLYIL